MKLQTLVALAALPVVFSAPVQDVPAASLDLPSPEALITSMSTFQSLITDAVANVTDKVARRDSAAPDLTKVNGIFDTIYNVLEGKQPAVKTLTRRSFEPLSDGSTRLVELLKKLLGGQSLQKRDGISDLEAAGLTLNSWAEGTLPFAVVAVSDFTVDDGVELATLLKYVALTWKELRDIAGDAGSDLSVRSAAHSELLALEKRFTISLSGIAYALEVVGTALLRAAKWLRENTIF